MRYVQRITIDVYVDDSTFGEKLNTNDSGETRHWAGGWPADMPWTDLLRMHYADRGFSDVDGNPIFDNCRVDVVQVHDNENQAPGYPAHEPAPAPFYVNVYKLNRCYGGPEEGGWWYDMGAPMHELSEVHDNRADALAADDRLSEVFLDNGHRFSVRPGDDDYLVTMESSPPAPWPAERPYYE